MSERGVIVTSPIYNTELRDAVFAHVRDWPKGAAMVCLSVVAAPGGTYAGAEKEDAEALARFISNLMMAMPETEIPDNLVIKVHCIADSADPAVYLAMRHVG
jgi:hypothetical protein